MSKVKIRLVREDELEKLGEIYAFEYQRLEFLEENWTKETATKFLRYWYEQQGDLFFVADVEGEPVGGFVAKVIPWHDGDHLVEGELFVSTKFHKNGFGKKLFNELVDTAIKKYDIVSIDFVTFTKESSSNWYPWEWYKRLGFKRDEKRFIFSGNARKVLENLKK